MIITYSILIFSLLVDGIISNFLPYMVNDLSLFTPFFTLVSIIIVFPAFKKDIKKYLCVVTILGFLYDLFYTNLLFANAIYFLLIGLLVVLLNSKFELNWFTNLIFIIILLCSYFLIYDLFIYIFNVVPLDIDAIIYQITHYLLLNILYGESLYFIFYRYFHKRHLN